jgi:hypothetical protein
MMNKINKERWRSINASPPHDPATRTSGKEHSMTPNKRRKGHEANHGRIITSIINKRK